MAGFFGRLANLWKGFLSLWVSDVEKKHPEIAYENAINSMVEKYAQLKKATASIIRRREEIEIEANASAMPAFPPGKRNPARCRQQSPGGRARKC